MITTRKVLWFHASTYTDPVTGMGYLSVGRSAEKSQETLMDFIWNELEL